MKNKMLFSMSLIFLLVGCQSVQQKKIIEEERELEKTDTSDIIYETLKGNLYTNEKKYKAAANSYNKVLKVEYNYLLAVQNLKIYLNEKDFYNLKKSYGLIKENGDEKTLRNKLTIIEKIFIDYYLENYNHFEKNVNKILIEKNYKKRIQYIKFISEFFEKNNNEKFLSYLEKNNFKNKNYLKSLILKTNTDLINNNINQELLKDPTDFNWNVLNIVYNEYEIKSLNSYLEIYKKTSEDSLLDSAYYIAFKNKYYNKSIQILNQKIKNKDNFKNNYTKLDVLFFTEKYDEFELLLQKMMTKYNNEEELIVLNYAYVNYYNEINNKEKLNEFFDKLSNKELRDYLFYYIKSNIDSEVHLKIEEYLSSSLEDEEDFYKELFSYFNHLKQKENFEKYYQIYLEKHPENSFYIELLYLSLFNKELLLEKGIDYFDSGKIIEEDQDKILNLIAYELSINSPSKIDLELAYSISLESLKLIENENIIYKASFYDTLSNITYLMGNKEDALDIIENEIINGVPFLLLDKEIINNYKKYKK